MPGWYNKTQRAQGKRVCVCAGVMIMAELGEQRGREGAREAGQVEGCRMCWKQWTVTRPGGQESCSEGLSSGETLENGVKARLQFGC